MSKKEFRETTSLPNFIIVLFFIQFILFLIYTISNKEDKILIYYLMGALLIGILLFFIRLKVKIDDKCVEYKINPFVNRKIFLSDIKSVKIVKVSALVDFMGWGIRYSKKYGWGYITNSEFALVIERNNGKTLTLSIKNIDELNKHLGETNVSFLKIK